MTKEKLTINNMKQDLSTVLNEQISNKSDWRLSYIMPFTLLAILLGVLLKSIFVGFLIFSLSGYHIYYFVIETKDFRKKKNMLLAVLDRGDVSVSTEILSHISNETIYEPHTCGKHTHSTKVITVFYFEGGASWRVPRVSRHYRWSREHNISSSGLKNISVKGNEFFLVSLQGNYQIAYIYPCKLFELAADLKQ